MGSPASVPACWWWLGYGVAFYLLAQVLRTIPLGITYAIWSGVGCRRRHAHRLADLRAAPRRARRSSGSG
jgi:hypothetical protein